MKNAMTPEERSRAALGFLEQAERELADGDFRQASEKLWGAATDAVTAIAMQRGWRYRSHRDLKNAVQRLASELDDVTLQAEFAAAEKFHINYYHDVLEDHEIEEDKPIVQDFVTRTLALLHD